MLCKQSITRSNMNLHLQNYQETKAKSQNRIMTSVLICGDLKHSIHTASHPRRSVGTINATHEGEQAVTLDDLADKFSFGTP